MMHYEPTWTQVQAVLKSKLDMDRAKLENLTTEEREAQAIRGRISLAKEIMQIPAELERKANLPR